MGKIIRLPLYRGEWQYGKDRHKRIDTPDGIKIQVSPGTEKISVSVPRIVGDSRWQLANDQLNENRKKFYRKTKREYLLRGRIRCGLCGRLMTGSGGNYRCPIRDAANYYHDSTHECNNRRADRSIARGSNLEWPHSPVDHHWVDRQLRAEGVICKI